MNMDQDPYNSNAGTRGARAYCPTYHTPENRLWAARIQMGLLGQLMGDVDEYYASGFGNQIKEMDSNLESILTSEMSKPEAEKGREAAEVYLDALFRFRREAAVLTPKKRSYHKTKRLARIESVPYPETRKKLGEISGIMYHLVQSYCEYQRNENSRDYPLTLEDLDTWGLERMGNTGDGKSRT